MAQEFKIGRLRYTWRGEWADAVVYNRDAVVQYNGQTYICMEPHTAQANFYDDLNYVTGGGASTPRWLLTIDGRVWKNAWQPNTFYSRGNIVKYGGIVYICTIPHTSESQELTGANWDTYSSYDNWNNAWTVSTVYGVGDIVKYGGIVYRCIYNHISASTTDAGLEVNLDYTQELGEDSTYGAWQVVNDGIEYKGQWQQATRYKRNDVVRNGADLYIATEGHTGVIPFDFNVPGDGPDDSTLSDSTDSKWALWQPGTSIKSDWQSTISYQIGDVVAYGGYSYRNLVANNVGNIPSSLYEANDSKLWDVVTEGYEYRSEWMGDQAYKIGSVVYQGGISYVATADNTGEAPQTYSVTGTLDGDTSTTTVVLTSTAGIKPGMIMIGAGLHAGQTVVSVVNETTIKINQVPDATLQDSTEIQFIGLNYLYWNILLQSNKHIGYWTKSANYLIGDVVIWQNGTYRCIQGHASGPATRPDLDIQYVYWAVHVLHAKENAGNTVGDIVTRKDDVNIATHILPIDEFGTEAAVGSTEDYVLQADNKELSWKNIQIVPNVYYVAPEGVDEATGGNDPDAPWKTIKYACEQIEHGKENPNARLLLKTNKEFLVEEMYQWMVWKVANDSDPFSASSTFDEAKTKRDARIVIDALLWDVTRLDDATQSVNSNTKTVFAALAYFAIESNTTFASPETEAAKTFIIASLGQLDQLIGRALQNLEPLTNYQVINGNWAWDIGTTYAVDAKTLYNDVWYIALEETVGTYPDAENSLIWDTTTPPSTVKIQDLTLPLAEVDSMSIMNQLITIITTAVTEEDKTTIPLPNTSYTSTIQIKTGSYFEQLPISVPEDTALNGDELRGVIVFPKDSVYTGAVAASAADNTVTLQALTNIVSGIPIQFFTENPNEDFGDIAMSTTYYVKDIIDAENKKITISETVGGPAFTVTTGTGFMFVYAGDCLKDMFYVRDATGIRNMTLQGLAGFLSVRNEFGTQRPTGGSYVSLDPGLGTFDTNVWIKRRSPYIQNVTNFGDGCTGLKISGFLHDGGNKSIVCNDFTQVISDGIGVWCTGPSALTECVSVFGYYNYSGYFAEDGGRIRATNGNSSYGTFGVVAEGYDDTEVPIAATVDNRSEQVQASVQSAFGANAELLSMQYANAGSGYYEQTTNMLKYSNNFLETWTNDTKVTIQQNVFSPIAEANAWTISGTTSNNVECYVDQAVSVTPTGFAYSGLSTLNISGSGVSAQFDITVGATAYTAEVFAGGSGYVTGNQVRVLGSELGGVDGVNDCILTVAGLAGSAILSVTVSGTVPTNSNKKSTFSIYVKQGTASTIDIDAIYSGTTTVTSSVNYSFSTKAFIATAATGGMVPTEFGRLELENDWTRIHFVVYDNNALNDTLTIRLWPRGKTGVAANTEFYGAQLQFGDEPTFYLDTTTNMPTAFANYTVIGAGTGADLVGDEIRSGSVFETRLTDEGIGSGGRKYEIASNNAQAGDLTTLTLSGADEGTTTGYVGMRAFLQSGTGAGQYGFVSSYDTTSKVIHVMKETFPLLDITETTDTTDLITVGTATTNNLYVNQPVEFIPTYYQSTVTDTAYKQLNVIATTGGTDNTLLFESTAEMSVNMPVRFYGTPFGGLTTKFTYYIKEVVDSTTITITTTPFGNALQLANDSETDLITCSMRFPGYTNTLTGPTTNMIPNMPLQFTGTAIGGVSVGDQYYVHDVIDANTFSISEQIVNLAVSATAATSNEITIAGTGALVLNPILFSGAVTGGVTGGTKYYIREIVDATTITVSSELISADVVATEVTTNLITLSSTAGFVANQPIRFTGNAFGGIAAGTTYYVLAVNDATTLTVSTNPSGSALALNTATGKMIAETPGAEVTLTTTTQAFGAQSTGPRDTIAYGFGSMIATYSTAIFGGVATGTTYYVKTIDSNTQFSISATVGGAAVTLQTRTGSMNLGEAGWDHINVGTDNVAAMDNSTVYFIEPRVGYSAPVESQTPYSLPTVAAPSEYNGLAYGNGKFLAIAGNVDVAAASEDGTTWSSVPLPQTKQWNAVGYGNGYWTIISRDGGQADPGSEALYSKADGDGWRSTYMPSVSGWVDVAYGNGKLVAIADDTVGNSAVAYSSDGGKTWAAGSGITNALWTSIAYNSGTFVAVAKGGTFNATSTTGGTGSGVQFDVSCLPGEAFVANTNVNITDGQLGASYTAGDVLTIPGTSLGGTSPTDDLVITVGLVDDGLALGSTAGAISTWEITSGAGSNDLGTKAAYSTNGTSWTVVALPEVGQWTDVDGGNGLFVAASKTSAKPCYSVDGITWVASPYTIATGKISYGQGVFVALSTTQGQGYTSENGVMWKPWAATNDAYGDITFGWAGMDYQGVWITAAAQGTGSKILAGTTAKGRAGVSSGKLTGITMWEPGSNYAVAPTITITDPNATVPATTQVRSSNGTLANPSFFNKGTGYNTNSTAIKIQGGGYADTYQVGTLLTVDNLARLPGPGDNLVINGIDTIYKVTSAAVVFGTVAPNIKANLRISPELTIEDAPEHSSAISIRTKYSQARLTGHDFLNVGYGTKLESRYPGVPVDTVLSPQDQAVEINFGRVFYVSTDQDGNFKVGSLFAVEQATGIVTISASQFGLSGLDTLSLGGVSIGNASVIIRQFSVEDTFVANSNEIIPTQRAVKAYLEGRLSQGGSNTFTGQLIAGTVLVGGPDKIRSTIPNGGIGSVVEMPVTSNFQGQFAGWDGDGMALQFFVDSWVR
tara:strand:+ start:6854 stop:15034 length:8181 start_codon:yes stop_codon:yes gene_type:complete